jgi:hypothetical protein
MTPKKTLSDREKELQAMIATQGGRAQLEKLEAKYAAAGGRLRARSGSLITYLLIYEREHGLIEK